MKKNMGSADRIIRILIAVTFVAFYFSKVISGSTGIILMIVAGVLFLTSLVGVCPLYLPFNLSSRKKG